MPCRNARSEKLSQTQDGVINAIRRGENAVITFLSVPAVLIVFQKTVRGMDVMELEHNSQDLLIFIGGFLVIAGVNLYFHFVR